MKFSIITIAVTLLGVSTSVIAKSSSHFPFSGGVNIAGFDFGIGTGGDKSNQYVAPDISQFKHFSKQGANIFRIPIGWNHLQPSVNGHFDSKVLNQYQKTVHAALATGAHVIIDIHNYARFDNKIIGQGQGDPSNSDFVKLWSKLAKKFNHPRIVYGIMNEPHDLDMKKWSMSVQAAIKAIRDAGSKKNFILIPGDHYSSLSDFISLSAPFLEKIKDPSHPNSNDYLIYDVHTYYDQDGSGTQNTCVLDRTPQVNALKKYLKQKNRKAFLSETGGANNPNCVKIIKSTLHAVKKAYPYFVGFTGWSAGAFDTNYVNSLTPNSDGSDQLIWKEAIKPNLPSKKGLK